MTHELLEEVWRNRDAFAKRHDYDLDAIVAELREMEKRPGVVVVNREEKTTEGREPQPGCNVTGVQRLSSSRS